MAFEDTIEFEPYKAVEEYKCAQIVGSPPNDPAMQLFQQVNNNIIRYLSKPFQHECNILLKNYDGH